MTIEQEFFECFGIEPIYIEGENTMEYSYGKLEYPKINDHILLELICLYNEFQNNTDFLCCPIQIEYIKENFLKTTLEHINNKWENRYFCNDVEKFKHKVQQLFKEYE